MYRALRTVCLDCLLDTSVSLPQLLIVLQNDRIEKIGSLLLFNRCSFAMLKYILKIKTKHALGIKDEVKVNSR